ncbi:DUF2846 domain-containing protein [Acinetobacter sp. 194]|uniref:DUF2846 domain-containing protein n=1 Tax=Acinetobacter shaoyimingii TaxID=2715164 RepID=UPI001407786E|nr:DUF2846 domain-containing protein [Acinetobacter shaoyimingii]NHB56509.1 DUF2846 domain-containing protein [Acinetobacter shaoyimingii]
MRQFSFILMTSLGLVACSSSPTKQVSHSSQLVSTLDNVDLDQMPGFFESKKDQYKVSGFSLGSWVNQKTGQYFKLVKPQHENAAVLYLYRPDSHWNREEIIAPSFFLNGKKIPSLMSNHHYWLELAEGDYKLSISRPLAVMHFQKPIVAYFSVKAGQQYFVKYEEEKFRGEPNGNENLLKVGPLMQMPTKQALKEIGMTQLKSPGLNYVAEVLPDGRLKKSKEKIDSGKYRASDDVRLAQPFKIYDPRTW